MSKWNCPEEYYHNCQNQQKKCKACVAGNGKIDLFYKPINPELNLHPYKKDEFKQRTYKRATENEKRIEREIAKGTIRSGAMNNDGDLSLLQGELRVEVKDRGKRSSWNLTWSEFDKGRKQGIDIYAINVLCSDGKPRTIYMMEDHLFNEWLALIKQNQQP